MSSRYRSESGNTNRNSNRNGVDRIPMGAPLAPHMHGDCKERLGFGAGFISLHAFVRQSFLWTCNRSVSGTHYYRESMGKPPMRKPLNASANEKAQWMIGEHPDEWNALAERARQLDSIFPSESSNSENHQKERRNTDWSRRSFVLESGGAIAGRNGRVP